MIRVGVRELKNRLSRYLKLVRQGEVIVVTDRQEVIAEIRHRTTDEESSRFDRYVDELELSGELSKATNPSASAIEIMAKSASPARVTGWRDALDETRGE